MLLETSSVVIIGAGECGVRAAFELRDRGFTGTIELISGESHLPYERPPLSKNSPATLKPIRPAEAYATSAIKLHLGRMAAAVDVDAHTVSLQDGEVFPYSALLLATGARPRLFPGMEKALVLRTLDDAERILDALAAGTRLIIIGGGFIGLELAATAVGRGAEVTVLEAAEHLMARAVPVSISDHVRHRHEQAGVRVLCSTSVSAIDAHGVTCADGSVYPADLVVAGVGAVPNVELAVSAGLAVDNGIVVDEGFRSSAVDVCAAGDCCSFPHRGQMLRLESWRAAQEQGALAAASMLGELTVQDSVPWFWSDQYDLGLQVAGLLPVYPGRSVTRRVGDHGGFIECLFDAQGKLSCAAGVGLGNAVAKDIRLLEMLMASNIHVDPAALGDENTSLKQLLKAG